MSDSLWRFADDLGPSKIVHLYDPGTDLRAIVVIDNVACGPSIGGCRMAPDVTVEECTRLARAMTFKNAAAGLPHGGGKSVIAADPKMPTADKERLVRSFARAIAQLEDYIVGPDMGTDETCMAWCLDEMGRSVGLPPELGGIPLDEIGATGYGLCAAALAAEPFSGLSLDGARVVIEGFGSVGQHAARFLSEKGALVVAVADTGGVVVREDGLAVDSLIEHKQGNHTVFDFPNGVAAKLDTLIDVNCDIFIPAARPDVIHAQNVDRVTARLVLPGANIAVTSEAEAILHERGVLVIPDFIANAGGVICAFVEFHGGTQSGAMRMIEEKISANTVAVLKESNSRGIAPREVAMELARKRIETAMRLRR